MIAFSIIALCTARHIEVVVITHSNISNICKSEQCECEVRKYIPSWESKLSSKVMTSQKFIFRNRLIFDIFGQFCMLESISW